MDRDCSTCEFIKTHPTKYPCYFCDPTTRRNWVARKELAELITLRLELSQAQERVAQTRELLQEKTEDWKHVAQERDQLKRERDDLAKTQCRILCRCEDPHSPETVYRQGFEACREAAAEALRLECEYSAPCWCKEPDEEGLGVEPCDCCNFIANVQDRISALTVPERGKGET